MPLHGAARSEEHRGGETEVTDTLQTVIHRSGVQPGDLRERMMTDQFHGIIFWRNDNDIPQVPPGSQQCWTPGTKGPPGRDRSGAC